MPAAPDPGVPEQDAEATLKSFTVAFATPVPITRRRSTPAVPFTAVVVAVVMFAPEDPAATSRPELSVDRERIFVPSEPALNVTGGRVAVAAGSP